MKFYLLSFDCESTGLSVYADQIVEFGAVLCLWDSDTGVTTTLPTFSEYAKPTVKSMCGKAAEMTGISMATLEGKPPIQSVLDRFMQHVDTVCDDETIPRLLLSYNGFNYDIPLMVAEIERAAAGSALIYFRKLRLQSAIDVLPFGRACIDTSILRRKANGACSYKLGDVYSAVCNQSLQNAHGAIADSTAVLDILQGCDAIQTAFQTLVTCPAPDNKQCENPMVLVRTVLARIATKNGGSNGKKTTSKRVLDMVQTHVQKKRRRLH
jgi:DNA polymerase III epsilon subunit-like protein